MVGSVTYTEIAHPPVKKIKMAWTSDASGNVSANLTAKKNWCGKIVGLVTVPSGVAAPTDDYDVQVKDADGVDVLLGAGANRDTANTEMVQSSSLGIVAESTLELVIANAGNAKQGTVYLYIQ